MMEALEWREETGGSFVAEAGRFSLIVRVTGSHQQARFVVLLRRSRGESALIGSGTTPGIREAMNAAEKTVGHSERSLRDAGVR